MNTCGYCGLPLVGPSGVHSECARLRGTLLGQSNKITQLTEEVARLRLAIRYAARHLSTPEYDPDCECEPCREAAAFHAVVKEIEDE